MNRLMQTDMNRLNSAESRHAKDLQQQPESVSAKTANDFRRLMADDEGENSTNTAANQYTEEHQHESVFAKTVADRTRLAGDDKEKDSTPRNNRNSAQTVTNGAPKDVTNGVPKDLTNGVAKDLTNGVAKDLTEHALGQNNTPLTADVSVNPAQKDTQPATGDASERTEDSEPNTANTIDESTFAGMTNPFSRLFSDSMPKMQPLPTEAVSSSSTADLAEKFIERILVSQPDKNGQEIRLQLSQESGMNAEVRLVRGLDGSLSITMHAADATTFQNLVAAQDRLKAALASQENSTVRVAVLSQTEQENNDANRRSRGYMPPESED